MTQPGAHFDPRKASALERAQHAPAGTGHPMRKLNRFCVRCVRQVAEAGGRWLAPGMFECALHQPKERH